MKQKCSICENEFESLLPHLAKKKICREKLGESKFQELREEARKARESKKNKKYYQTVEAKLVRERYYNSEKALTCRGALGSDEDWTRVSVVFIRTWLG